MSKLHYVGPRVEITNRGIVYKNSKEDKYIYLFAALEILKDIDNDYEKRASYVHYFKDHVLEENYMHTLLQRHEVDVENCISEECKKYKQKMQYEIDRIKMLPYITEIDKKVWIKNIEIMKEYKMQRAINKMYYMHCIQDIVKVIQHKKIKEITAPFNKDFFHVLNTLKGALITSKPSLDAKVIEKHDINGKMSVQLTIR